MAIILRTRRPLLSFPFLALAYSSSCKQKPHSLPLVKPPTAKRIPSAVCAHGKTWDDPYRWMSNTDDPDLINYLTKENSYAEVFMADTMDLRRRLVEELKGRMPARVTTPPESWGDWLYYQYIPEGKEFPILCRRAKSPKGFANTVLNYLKGIGEEKILLDWNEIAENFGYVHVGTCRISPNHKYIAYTLDRNGSEVFVLQVKDLQTGRIISNSGVEGVISLAWTSDSNCLLYTVCDESLRPYRVFCTNLASNVADDLLFTENDTSCCVDITNTKDGKFITINSNSRASSEVYVMDAANLKDGLWLVRKRVPGVQYFLEHHHGFFYILNNSPLGNMGSVSKGYYLASCRAEKSLMSSWQAIILPDEGFTFHDMDMFHGHMVLSVQKEGVPLFCSVRMPIDATQKLPDVMVDYNMAKRTFTILHQEDVVGLSNDAKENFYVENFHSNFSGTHFHGDKHLHSPEVSLKLRDLSEAFSCERKEVISHDGVKIPLTILYSKSIKFSGQSPGVLHGYGAYGEVLDKSWSSDLLCLLNRGWVFAYADVRGGGGNSSWHQAGTGAHKLNSMYDFAACGSYLISEGYVNKNQLCAIGTSAGGLLVGACINMYPDLFCAAVLKSGSLGSWQMGCKSEREHMSYLF